MLRVNMIINDFNFNFNALFYEYIIDLLYLIYFNIHKV